MNILHGLLGLAIFLAFTAFVGGALFGWVVGWINTGEWLDRNGYPEWCGIFAAAVMPFIPILVLLLGFVFFSAARQ